MAAGGYAPTHVNVHDQRRDPDSLWSFIAALAPRYRSTPEIAWGEFEVLDGGDSRALVHRAAADGIAFIGLHNFFPEPLTATLPPLPDGRTVLVESRGSAPQIDHSEQRLDGYGFRWLRESPASAPAA